MSITGHNHMSEGDVVRARRVEVFTGAGRRRAWTPDEKAARMAATLTKIVGGHLNSEIDDLLPWAYASPQPLKHVA